MITGTSIALTLPTDGRRLFARLYSKINGELTYNAYTFNAFTSLADPKAAIQAPAIGSTFSSGNVTFNWSAGSGVSEIVLGIGSSLGSYDLHAAVETGPSATVTLPTDGRPVYVTLFSKLNGVFESNQYVYTAALGSAPPAEGLITKPANGSILTSTNLILDWTPGSAATEYVFWVGSKSNGYDLYSAVQSYPGTNGVPALSPQVQIPLDGRRIYVTLFSKVNGAFRSRSYSFDTTQ